MPLEKSPRTYCLQKLARLTCTYSHISLSYYEMKKCGVVCFVWWGHYRVATVGAAIEINWLRLFENGSQSHQPSEYYARSTKLTLRYLLEGHGRKNHRSA